ncbi:MAG: carboxypeptidase-like regulatory domain-containing protein [Candidatus Methanoplasma sp.]|jgi:hypothetical protein|nr:carboxypeptidase-like regulatory domain-containing protein [Candidatus Methanoplasma sp.]
MFRRVLPLVLIAAVLLLSVPFSPSDGAEGDQYHIEGYVAGWNGSGRVPMEGVSVTVAIPGSANVETTTDADGLFSIATPSNVGLQIKFYLHGYSIVTCPNTEVQAGSEFLLLKLSDGIYNKATKTYALTSAIDGMQSAIMAASRGTIRGTVSYDDGVVSGATVHLDSVEGGASYSVNTNSNGTYEIECPVGPYSLRVARAGFDDSIDYNVTVDAQMTTVSVTLKKAEINTYFGLDSSHILMLIGVVLGMILAVSAWLISRRMNSSDGVEIIDDSDSDQDDGLKF